MKSFTEVTRATQIKWLRQLGEMALRQYGIENAQLRFISKSSSFIFRVDAQGQQYALRIDSEPAHDQWQMWTQGELFWLSALRQDVGLLVPEPVEATDGTLVPCVSTANIPDGRLVTVLKWIPGQRIRKRPMPNVVSQIGAFMAQLHNHTEQFSLPDDISRPHTDWRKLTYWQDPKNDTSNLLTVEQRNLCAEASHRLLADIEALGIHEDYGLIHADLTLDNCLLHQNQLWVIDFADCRFASHFYDIAALLTNLMEYWSITQNEYEDFREEFYQGYRQFRPLKHEHEQTVALFEAARAFDIVEWIHLDWPDLTYFPFDLEILPQAIQRIRDYMQ